MLSPYHCSISARTASKPTSRTGAGASPRRSASPRSTMITSRSALQPAASKPLTRGSPPRSTSTLRWRRPAGAWRRSASASRSSAEAPAASSTTRRLRSHLVGCAGVKNATPCPKGSARAVTRSKCARRCARRRPRSVVPVAATRAPDHDLVLLDRDLHRPVARPVLGVDRVVLDRGIEPEPVALLAMVEGALERLAGAAPGAAAAAAAGAPAGRRRLVAALFALGLGVLVGGALGGLLREAGLLFRAPRLLGLELGGDGRVVLRAEVDLLERLGGVAVRLEVVLALERLDLLDRHLELMGDPGVRPPLPDPPSDLVELRAQRSATHGGRGHYRTAANALRVQAPL